MLIDSVAAHLRADVPYGLFLSGGIDSSALLALMRRATGQRIQALTVGWEGGRRGGREPRGGAAGRRSWARTATGWR